MFSKRESLESKGKRLNVLRLVQLGILIALEAVLAFTPLGFIMIPPISITILHIPVIIAGIMLGPSGGAIVGASFGLMAMFRAMTSGNPGDLLFNPFASGNPIGSIVMCILPRILLGLIAALLFLIIKKLSKNDYVAIPVTAAVSTALHTIMVLGLLWGLFQAFPLKEVFLTVVQLNGIIEICTAVVIATAVCKPLMKVFKKKSPKKA